jgi:hypothetical protein
LILGEGEVLVEGILDEVVDLVEEEDLEILVEEGILDGEGLVPMEGADLVEEEVLVEEGILGEANLILVEGILGREVLVEGILGREVLVEGILDVDDKVLEDEENLEVLLEKEILDEVVVEDLTEDNH